MVVRTVRRLRPNDAFRWTFVDRTEEGWDGTIAGWGTTGRLIYTVWADSEVVGTDRVVYDLEFLTGRDDPDVCEVGHTWYVPAVRGTTVNPACKLLLFTQHVRDLEGSRGSGCGTDARNATARAAMLKLGMTFEGIRRRHMIGADGDRPRLGVLLRCARRLAGHQAAAARTTALIPAETRQWIEKVAGGRIRAIRRLHGGIISNVHGRPA